MSGVNPRAVLALLKREFWASLHSRWLIGFAVVFFLSVLGIPFLLLQYRGLLPRDYFFNTLPVLVSATFPLVPLLPLVLGSRSIVGEKERGTLEFLASQPISKSDITLGKYLGLLLAVSVALSVGFGAAAFVTLGGGLKLAPFLGMTTIGFSLAASMLSLAFLISIFSREGATALGTALVLWFFLVIIASASVVGGVSYILQPEILIFLTFVNPVEISKLLALLVINPAPTLEVLGPSGLAVLGTYGVENSVLFLFSSLLAWVFVPVLLSFAIFRERDAI